MSPFSQHPIDDPLFADSHNGDIECEWDSFITVNPFEDVCNDPATICVLDHDPVHQDPTYPEGFHTAHLCAFHWSQVSHLYDG